MTRFEAYTRRRTREALAAAIDPFTTEIDCAGSARLALGNRWARRLFDGPFYLSPAPSASLPAASLVFVRSRDGDTVADDPSALGGGEADKHLIYEGLARVAADGVLSGAATIRAPIWCCRSGVRSWSRCAPRSACRDIRCRLSPRSAACASTTG